MSVSVDVHSSCHFHWPVYNIQPVSVILFQQSLITALQPLLLAKYNVFMVFKSVYSNILDKVGHYFSLKTLSN